MGCDEQKGEGRKKWVRDGRKKAFSLWSCSCINTKIILGPTKSWVIWAPPHFVIWSMLLPSLSGLQTGVDFLRSHYRTLSTLLLLSGMTSPSPSLGLLSLLFSFILKHCFLEEVFVDLGHVHDPLDALLLNALSYSYFCDSWFSVHSQEDWGDCLTFSQCLTQ